MKMIYRSHRSLGDVAQGLMVGCFRYFEEEVQIERRDLSEGNGSIEEFILTPLTESYETELYESQVEKGRFYSS